MIMAYFCMFLKRDLYQTDKTPACSKKTYQQLSSSDDEQIPIVPNLSKSTLREKAGASKSQIQAKQTPRASTSKFMTGHVLVQIMKRR